MDGTGHSLSVGERLRVLRTRCGLSARELGRRAGVTAAMISCVERERNSPSVATLQKILAALGSDLASFFSAGGEPAAGPVYRREAMRVVGDADRRYTLVFPRRKGLGVEMLDEQIRPSKRKPAFETLSCAVAGYVLAGTLVLELAGEGPRRVRPGDGFYVPAGIRHRGWADGAEGVRLITVCTPPRY
jgi:transcriptional regulator with XRE-family HTH domain